jgi:hypothetical protein
MMHPQSMPHRKKRRVFQVGQQRSLDPTRRFSSRARKRAQRCQIPLANCQFDRCGREEWRGRAVLPIQPSFASASRNTAT